MVSWVIIIILVIAGIISIKMNHLRHRVFIIILIMIALFFYITMTFVTNKNEVDLTTYDGFVKGMKIYGGWLANGFSNIKALTGNAVKMDWKSTDGSFFSNSSKSKTDNSKATVSKGKVTIRKN
jgi:hypothetical protein